jgi:hypothetical protein
MSSRTYVCFDCKTAYREEFGKRRRCSGCQKECTALDWRARIPKTGDDKGWQRLQERHAAMISKNLGLD